MSYLIHFISFEALCLHAAQDLVAEVADSTPGVTAAAKEDSEDDNKDEVGTPALHRIGLNSFFKLDGWFRSKQTQQQLRSNSPTTFFC